MSVWRVDLRVAFAAVLLCVGLAAPALRAAPIGLEFNAGPVTSLGGDFNGAFFSDFQVGEDIIIGFTLSDATPDGNTSDEFGEFQDPFGLLTIAGQTSGASRSNTGFTFLLRNGFSGPNRLYGFGFQASSAPNSGLRPSMNYGSFDPILSDPNNLSQSIAELNGLLQGGIFTDVGDFGGNGNLFLEEPNTTQVMKFGPIASQSSPAVIPVPASVPLLGSALLAFSLVARHRRRRAQIA